MEGYHGVSYKATFHCEVCGNTWETTPYSLLHATKYGCPVCAAAKRREKITKTRKQFIEELSEKNPNIQVLGEYVNTNTKIQVRCKKCGREYFATPDHLLNGEGCVVCSYNHLAELNRSSKEDLQAKLDEKGYPVVVLGDYVNTKTNIKCHCNICNIDFDGTPSNLLKGKRGCACLDKLESRGEQKIRMWLIENDIDYIPQYSFKECCDKKPLRFDFFIPDKNLCIEYDGIQHFKRVDFSWKNTEESLKKAQNNFE